MTCILSAYITTGPDKVWWPLQNFNTNEFICVIPITVEKVLKCVRLLWAWCVLISGRMSFELRSAVCPSGSMFWLMWLPSSCVPLCICAQMYPFAFLNPPASQEEIRYIWTTDPITPWREYAEANHLVFMTELNHTELQWNTVRCSVSLIVFFLFRQ